MNPLDMAEVRDFVSENMSRFHNSRIGSLGKMSLKTILRNKNPYLFRAKNITRAEDLIQSIMDAFLSSSEEKLFGDFLEDLAVFVSGKTCNGQKSAATGVDLEFDYRGVRYLVSVKSGPNWGNSSQQRKQKEDFETAVRVLKQSGHTLNVQPVLGICYGRTRTSFLGNYMKAVGQNFWYFLSENKDLYTEIVEPLGFEAGRHNEHFLRERSRLQRLFSEQFKRDFCDQGIIDWSKVLRFNSGNLDLTWTDDGIARRQSDQNQ